MSPKKLFKTNLAKPSRPTDPESMFRDLKRAPEIKHLWSHEADILRTYHKNHLKTFDVALEVPTGTGKTLIGLLIAEFRRRLNDERVVYLTPNRMLANQVGALAEKYGIPVQVLVGPQANYPASAFHEYKMNKAIAITTYSGLFNTHPRLNDAQVIILDDAHASENFIAKLWSVELSRKANPKVWKGLVDLYAASLPEGFAERLQSDEPDPKYEYQVDIVPGPYFRKHLKSFRSLLNAHLEEPDSAWYAWSMVEPHVPACNLFLTWSTATLRPLIPPTHLHSPFNDASQRIYMSATLGEGGELERIVGVRTIERIPVPSGWDKRGSGRRLFLLPDLSLKPSEVQKIECKAVDCADRALVLTPNDASAAQVTKEFLADGYSVLGAGHIEDDLSHFTGARKAVLVLANRYDGIDLPDEDCRLLIVYRLPIGTNLQERFLYDRLAATSLLRDRMVTRLTQSVGRCTRSDNDYAAVILIGQELVDFVSRSDTRILLHPELQAELEFGIDNSRDRIGEDFKTVLTSFLAQDADWRSAEPEIQRLRAEKKRGIDPIATSLRTVVCSEIDYMKALWRGDYSSALHSAKDIADSLGGPDTKGYRAWWYYLAADAAMLEFEKTKKAALQDTAMDLFGRACKASPAISWLAELARIKVDESKSVEVDELTALAVGSVHNEIKKMGLFGVKFERDVTEGLAKLRSADHDTFVQGLKTLGDYLGFDASTNKDKGAPDCIWSIKGHLHIVFEAKPEQKADGTIGVETARQASGHLKWVRAHVTPDEKIPLTGVLITPRTTISKEAVIHANGLYHCTPEHIVSLGEDVVGVLRKIRSECGGASDEASLERIRDEVMLAAINPKAVNERLTKSKVTKLRQVS